MVVGSYLFKTWVPALRLMHVHFARLDVSIVVKISQCALRVGINVVH